jgi:DNA polymerase elongation subunit (family B)
MLVDFQYLSHTKQVIVSYTDSTGDIKLKHFKWEKPTNFHVCQPNDPDRHPTYRTWNDKPVKKIPVSYPDRYSLYEFIDSLPQADRDEIYAYNEPKIYFIDIETEITDGFPSPETAPDKVTAISIVYDDKIMLMGTKDLSSEDQKDILKDTNNHFKSCKANYQLKYIKYKDEFDMLYAFFYKMIPKMPMISGWYINDFDIPYLMNRARKMSKTVNGQRFSIDPAVSSFTKRLTKMHADSITELPAHRIVLDYMKLYQCTDTSIKVKESNSLDFVGDKLVGVAKIKYNGSLQKLYEDDFKKYMYYNCVDSVLVQQIHLKMNYASIIFAIGCLAKIKVGDVVSKMEDKLASIGITEGVLRGRFRDENVVLFRDETHVDNSLAGGLVGGYVKEPVTGMNMWCSCYDFASLYPHQQMQYFIAPENFRGNQIKDEPEYALYEGQKIKIDPAIHAVLINGCVFEKRVSPTIKMLKDVYADRKKHKKMMMGKKEELKKLQNELKELENSL